MLDRQGCEAIARQNLMYLGYLLSIVRPDCAARFGSKIPGDVK
jgi:hypothetical protein